jgi:hypothetical protein
MGVLLRRLHMGGNMQGLSSDDQERKDNNDGKVHNGHIFVIGMNMKQLRHV